MNISAHEVGLHLATSNTRSKVVHLVHQHPNSMKFAALFSCRIAPRRNTLPIHVKQAETLTKFKKLV